jgi:hypothetical protein
LPESSFSAETCGRTQLSPLVRLIDQDAETWNRPDQDGMVTEYSALSGDPAQFRLGTVGNFN